MAPRGRRPRTAVAAQQANQTVQGAAQAATQSTAVQTTVATISAGNATATASNAAQTVVIGQHTVRRGRAIRGPQSALTDFLASHNISANQIRLDHERRRQQVLAGGAGDGDEDAGEGPSNANPTDDEAGEGEDTGIKRKTSKRKLDQQKAIDKIKASKKFQKRKKHLADSDEEDDLIKELLKNSGPQPGQMANCTYIPALCHPARPPPRINTDALVSTRRGV